MFTEFWLKLSFDFQRYNRFQREEREREFNRKREIGEGERSKENSIK
jgi:hypothetical protein